MALGIVEMDKLYRYNIIGDTLESNIDVALNIIINNISSFSGIHLLGFTNYHNDMYYINDEIINKIKFSCEVNNLSFLSNYGDLIPCDVSNKNIVYIVNRDYRCLDYYLTTDHYMIYINMLDSCKTIPNKDFEIFIKYDNCYYNDNIVYNYKKYSTEELTSEFKKKL